MLNALRFRRSRRLRALALSRDCGLTKLCGILGRLPAVVRENPAVSTPPPAAALDTEEAPAGIRAKRSSSLAGTSTGSSVMRSASPSVAQDDDAHEESAGERSDKSISLAFEGKSPLRALVNYSYR